jgi:hypothetical protein
MADRLRMYVALAVVLFDWAADGSASQPMASGVPKLRLLLRARQGVMLAAAVTAFIVTLHLMSETK